MVCGYSNLATFQVAMICNNEFKAFTECRELAKKNNSLESFAEAIKCYIQNCFLLEEYDLPSMFAPHSTIRLGIPQTKWKNAEQNFIKKQLSKVNWSEVAYPFLESKIERP